MRGFEALEQNRSYQFKSSRFKVQYQAYLYEIYKYKTLSQ